MIKEEYVSFEVAKLLKEKGFNGDGVDAECHMFYSDYTETIMPVTEIALVPYNEVYFAPTQQMAMRLLREIYDIHIVPKKDFFGGYYTGRIYDGRREIITDKDDYIACAGYDSYEEATEAAIKYVLENLK